MTQNCVIILSCALTQSPDKTDKPRKNDPYVPVFKTCVIEIRNLNRSPCFYGKVLAGFILKLHDESPVMLLFSSQSLFSLEVGLEHLVN